MESAKQRPQRQSQQSQPSGAVCHVETQLAIVETSSSSYIERLHFVFIVADEHKRRATIQLLTIDADTDIKKRITPQHRERRPEVRGPLAALEPLLFFAFANNAWIKSQA